MWFIFAQEFGWINRLIKYHHFPHTHTTWQSFLDHNLNMWTFWDVSFQIGGLSLHAKASVRCLPNTSTSTSASPIVPWAIRIVNPYGLVLKFCWSSSIFCPQWISCSECTNRSEVHWKTRGSLVSDFPTFCWWTPPSLMFNCQLIHFVSGKTHGKTIEFASIYINWCFHVHFFPRVSPLSMISWWNPKSQVLPPGRQQMWALMEIWRWISSSKHTKSYWKWP